MSASLSKILAGLLLSLCVALGGWNLKATHDSAREIAVMRQVIIDGKEDRLRNEANLKALESQLAQLRLDSKGVEVRIAGLEVAVKNVELQIAESKSQLLSLELALRKK